MKQFTFFLTLLYITAGMLSCSDEKFNISDVQALNSGDQVYSLTGYFTTDPVPMIVSDTLWIVANTPIPDSEYILLEGSPQLDSFMARHAGNLNGLSVSISGVIDLMAFGPAESDESKVIIPSDIKVNASGSASFISSNPPVVDLDQRLFAPASRPYPDKFALLFSGGENPAQARIRYWNDLAFMYNTLISRQGFKPDQIIVVYKDGAPENNDMPVYFPATQTGFDAALTALQAKLDANRQRNQNQLFVFTTNHGGGLLKKDNRSYGGADSYAPNDETDETPTIDETLFLYADPASYGAMPYYIDEVFAAKIKSLHYSRLVVVMEQCFGGGFIKDMTPTATIGRNPKSGIFITAAKENEFSYAYSASPISNAYNSFSYFFTCALNGATHTGQPLQKHLNLLPSEYDGKVGTTLWESYWYANLLDLSSHHLIEDNGDGSGTAYSQSSWPSCFGNHATVTGDGAIANGISL